MIDNEFFYDALTDAVHDDVQILCDAHDHWIDHLGQILQNAHLTTQSSGIYDLFPQNLIPHLPDLDILHPKFAWVSLNHIKDSIEKTSQFYSAVTHFPLSEAFLFLVSCCKHSPP